MLAVKGFPNVPFDPPGRFETRFTLDAVIDGSDTAGTMKMTGKLTGRGKVKDRGGRDVALEFDISIAGEETRTSQK